LGDSATTGDMVANFTTLEPRHLDSKKEAWKKVLKAHKRAIDLSYLHIVGGGEIEMDHRINYLSWLNRKVQREVWGRRAIKYGPKRLQSRIEELGLNGSTYEAESYAIQAQRAIINKDWDLAQDRSEIARKNN